MITGVIVHYTGWAYADPLISLIIAGIIVTSGWGILRDAIDILIEGTPSDLDAAKIVQTIKTVSPVVDVHDLHIWKVTDGMKFLSCHITLPSLCTLTQVGAVIETINKLLHDRFAIGHTTIQPETNEACGMNEKDDLFCPMEAHPH